MKQFLLFILGVVFFSVTVSSQITTPIIKAAFGVDADLRANYFNGFVQSGNDDWFNNGTAGTGFFVIDTAGAAAVVAGYLSDVSPWPRRMTPIYRSMSRPKFSIINNRIWLDAIFVRDHHGTDSSVFTAGSDKNGMSPANWTGGIQGVPDKNDILDVFMHVRRAGPTNTDSLWMFGGISLDNTTGNRYFDFEMYQTDIYYDIPSGKFYGYGPDAGHTSWILDAAGNVIRPGDIIFTAQYQSSTLTNIEARIWIDQATLSITPAQFNWSGQFDGATAGAQYGYASILPKTAGAFYTGLGSGNNTWAGPFQLVLQDNSLTTTYTKDQFMEFSVNLTKLGLDPVSLLGGDVCGTPFNRLVVKTRASSSFTAELKDFIAPINLFLAPRVDIGADVPVFCGMSTNTSTISVLNPHSTSVYTWTTLDGHIVTTPASGPFIQVDQPGTYIVEQRLMAGCNPYAVDTITILRDSACNILPARFKSISGVLNAAAKKTDLQWTVTNNGLAKSFVVEASVDGESFIEVGTLSSKNLPNDASYDFTYDVPIYASSYIDFRIRMISQDGSYAYSRVLRVSVKDIVRAGIVIAPNPVRGKFQIAINSSINTDAKITFLDMQGRTVMVMNEGLKKGMNVFSVTVGENWQAGMYNAVMKIGQESFNTRFVVLE